jgi:hypothetical protein
MTQVRAKAVVEKIDSGPVPVWEVETWGEPPHDHRRALHFAGQN